MAIKKFVFCVLFFTHAINSAEENDSDNKKISISTVEEDSLINKNNWNTRKWGSIYLLFPHLSIFNIIFKNDNNGFFCKGKLETDWGKIFNFIASGVIEYKYMFHKYCGINVRLNLNNLEACSPEKYSFFSLEPSLEWIYGRKGKHIFSGSFSLVGIGFMQEKDGSLVNDFCKKWWTLGFVLLKYEYDRRFYLNFGKIKKAWYNLNDICEEESVLYIGLNLVSIEFGLNIIGVNDWRKKRKENLV